MATRKKAGNPQSKMLLTAVNKVVTTNTVLPILENILFIPGKAIVTDLETVAIIPFDMPGVPQEGITLPAKMFCQIMDIMESPAVKVNKDFSCTLTHGKRSIGIKGEDPMNYPKTPDVLGVKPAGRLSAQNMTDLATAMLFVSNDDLRPSMTGVYFCEEMVSTDSHRLYHKKIDFKQTFITPAKSLKTLLALGGEYDVSFDGIHTLFQRHDGVQIISRSIDARFPNYKAVIPTEGHTVTLNMCPHLLSSEVKNAMKFANRSTWMIKLNINESSVRFSSEDVDFSFSYENEIAANIERHKLEKGEHCAHTAFNGKFLLQVIEKHTGDGPVKIQLWSPTKAAIINESFLLMPLMLDNQQ